MTPSSGASPLFEACVLGVSRAPWPFESTPERGEIRIETAGPLGRWWTFVRVFDDDSHVVVYGALPFAISADRRAAATELITRINFGLPIGNFELDLADGELRCRTSLDTDGIAEPGPLCLSLVRANIALVDAYLPAFIAITAPSVRALDALMLVE